MNKKKRKVFVYSTFNNYMEEEYIDKFKEKNASLMKGTKKSLREFIENNKEIVQLDTETNVTDYYSDRELYVVQLGTVDMTEQHIFDIKDLSNSNLLGFLHEYFRGDTTFIAHNAKFEYIVLYKFFGTYIKNFKDTMLASQLATAGLDLPKGYNSLAYRVKNSFGIDLDKGSQTTFDGLKMSPDQLMYAVMDVLYLGKLLERLEAPLKKWKLMKAFKLENKTLRALGDETINGIGVETDILNQNIVTYDKRVSIARAAMIEAFSTDDSKGVQEKLRDIGIIQKEDEVIINWRSSVQKKSILNYLYPNEDIKSTAKTILIKLEKTVSNPSFLTKILNDNTDDVEMILVSRHKKFLIENGMFISKGTLNLNFNSPSQLLEFFRIWYPKLNSVGVKPLKKLKHPVVEAFKTYSKSQKLVSSFGRKMFNYIESDGRIHGNFTAMAPSGSRMSSSKPNVQQSPSTEEYRRMYVPRPGWKFVDSDYSSAEVFIAAYLSKDKKMLHAIKKGYDMHSYSAFMIFGDKWIEAGGSATPLGKPATKEAGAMRKKSKGASFGIFYGTGVTSFSENNDMTLKEGKDIMDKYYKAFPELVAFFKKSGQDALIYNYIREPHFGRVRFFNKPKNGMEASHNKNAGMNYKPQAINMSIMKYAMCLMKAYIEANELDDRVKLILTVHDQQLSEVRDDFVDEWEELQTSLMEKAALYVIPEGTLKVETDVLTHWTKG